MGASHLQDRAALYRRGSSPSAFSRLALPSWCAATCSIGPP